MTAIEMILWGAIALVVYAYFGYGLAIALIGLFKRQPTVHTDRLPPVTLVIAAYNEQDIIAEKIENSFQLDYPAELLEILVAAEDRLNYNEPADWPLPTRWYLGAALLDAGDAQGAAEAYRQDLKTYPDNGWSLHGLAQAQRKLGDATGGADSERRFRAAWQWADAPLAASRY